jgi:hypothetical protein
VDEVTDEPAAYGLAARAAAELFTAGTCIPGSNGLGYEAMNDALRTWPAVRSPADRPGWASGCLRARVP